MTQTELKNPSWWNDEHDSAWNRVKAAFKRDWDQTKHDFGGDTPETNQKIGNTVRQSTGAETIPPRGQIAYDDLEPAFRFGYGARSHYLDDYPDWNEDLETQLKEDWRETNPTRANNWNEDLAAIRHGWDYNVDDE